MLINYWIVKSPFKHHPWSDILFTGKFHLFGIRNYQARNYIQKMKAGDKALFYSSSNGRKIFGIMEVSKDPYQYPSISDGRWLACDFKPVFTFPKPVPSNELKNIPGFKDSTFFKQPRVSVIKIEEDIFNKIVKLGSDAGNFL